MIPAECDRPDCGCEAMRPVDYADARYGTDTVNRCTDSLRRCPDTEEDDMTDTAPMSAHDAVMHDLSDMLYAADFPDEIAHERVVAYIAAQAATIARLTTPIADDATRAAVERFERGCERRGVRCAEWYTFPYNICLGCVDDTFHHHQYVAGHEVGTGAATITTALKQAESERVRLVAIEGAARADRRTWSCQSAYGTRIDFCPDCKIRGLCSALDKEATS